MTPEQFCYWLQGLVENQKTNPTTEQWANIRNHLETVFHKVTPVINPSFPEYHPYPNTFPPTKVIC